MIEKGSSICTPRIVGILGCTNACIICASLGRQRGRVVRVSDLKSVGRGFKSRSDR